MEELAKVAAVYIQALAGNALGLVVLGIIGIIVALVLLRRFTVGWSAGGVKQDIINDLTTRVEAFKADYATAQKLAKDKEAYAEELSRKLFDANDQVLRMQQDKLADELFLARLHTALLDAIDKLDRMYPGHGVTMPDKPKSPSDMYGQENTTS